MQALGHSVTSSSVNQAPRSDSSVLAWSKARANEAIADGRLPLARALLSERTLTRPNSAGSWSRYAAVLDGLGEAEAAAAARERGARVKTAA